MKAPNGKQMMITETFDQKQLELQDGTALPTGAVVQLPLWAAKLALRIAGLKNNASHTIILVRDNAEVRFSIDSVEFERIKPN